ncbi:hypothetical protein VOLCADRAFT_81992 [Volvox carteri f. nagariensis]|uniref:Phytanoyl-CoA dioxygenase n=1 Tax=Volvox carteri f. nagariensis TaxID=3068 RepID=D8U2C8_VOLCA|nr:uncharacterized protein VOLCADRAFT_81992 [Volvox carteri f. nagariensis]EFJ46040.1 hypothetical protein VOLCADRAFT_81992 [Volvox carteri f. nagariensis]|eukprot:XP_002952790.1 hypothetical protein VOLCADRAFT_81992 [Volvox carteri f. nagariensis]
MSLRFGSHGRQHVARGKEAKRATRKIASLIAAYKTAPTSSGTLTPEQVAQFHNDGFLVLERFASPEDCIRLRKRIDTLLHDFDPKTISIFTTRDQAKKTDNYFLNSASDVGFFFEDKAFDEDGKLRQAKELSINKVGHALHDLDPVFREFSRSPAVCNVLRSLGYNRPLPVQSMYIFKQPSIGGEVVPHQDSTFIHTTPLSCVGLWWALEDATRDNGCLWAIPGIHKEGLRRRFLLAPDGSVFFDKPQPAYDMSAFVPLECPAGTLVLLHGENVHYSAENTSPVSRHSYSMHLVESANGVAWSSDNWYVLVTARAPFSRSGYR